MLARKRWDMSGHKHTNVTTLTPPHRQPLDLQLYCVGDVAGGLYYLRVLNYERLVETPTKRYKTRGWNGDKGRNKAQLADRSWAICRGLTKLPQRLAQLSG
jgi:hypothetical protein